MPPTTLPAGAASGSFWDLLSHMSGFATIILLILVFMSVVSWAIIIHKFRLYRAVSHSNELFIQGFRKRKRLIDAEAKCAPYKTSPLFKILVDGFGDLQGIVAKKKGQGNIQAGLVELNGHDLDAIQKTLERSSNERIAELEKYVVFLATTGNSAPFFGLLGTCWGIMNAFMSIGARGSASLAVVAPGIAEALIATIVGLGAAIPAVIAYNWCRNKLRFITGELDNFSLEFLSAVQKENEF
jgi:biopolymer transport protein TolQ